MCSNYRAVVITVFHYLQVCGVVLVTLIMSLPASAVVFQVVNVTLLLFQGISNIIFEEVVLDLNLLDGVGCLLDCGGLGLVDFCLLCCEVERSFDAKCGGQVGVEGVLDAHCGRLEETHS